MNGDAPAYAKDSRSIAICEGALGEGMRVRSVCPLRGVNRYVCRWVGDGMLASQVGKTSYLYSTQHPLNRSVVRRSLGASTTQPHVLPPGHTRGSVSRSSSLHTQQHRENDAEWYQNSVLRVAGQQRVLSSRRSPTAVPTRSGTKNGRMYVSRVGVSALSLRIVLATGNSASGALIFGSTTGTRTNKQSPQPAFVGGRAPDTSNTKLFA